MALSGAVATTALPAMADDTVVFAASSLQTALDQIAADFEAATGDNITLVYAASSVLARQIVAGAPADIFIAASEDWMDWVAAQGVPLDQRRTLVSNTLVVIAPRAADAAPLGSVAELPERLGAGRLALALVDSVPAGQYARAALTSQWQALEMRVVQTNNVRAALALVALGEAAYGVVYGSDARAEPRVSVVYSFAAGSHPPIRYPAALMGGAGETARAFFAALTERQAQAVFAAQGFAAAGSP